MDHLLNPTKSQFGVPSLNFLGHIVDRSGISPMEDKVHAIRDFPEITSVRKLREFLGLVNFYRRFIPHCAEIVQPLTDLLRGRKKKNEPITLHDTALKAFSNVNVLYCHYHLLTYGNNRDRSKSQHNQNGLLLSKKTSTYSGKTLGN